jgi:hypothetical protein
VVPHSLAAAVALACQVGNLKESDQLNTQEVQNLVGLDQTQEVEKQVEKDDVVRQSSVVCCAKEAEAAEAGTPSQKMKA